MPEITITQGNRRFHLTWEVIHKDRRCIRIKVHPVSNPDKYLILENNEPLIRSVYKLKNRRIDWKFIEGEGKSDSILTEIIKQITRPDQPGHLPPPIPRGKKKKDGGHTGPTLGERNSV